MIPGWRGPVPEPEIRSVEDMRGVLADPHCQEAGPLYSMYRDLAMTDEDADWLLTNRIRFDITLIPPRTLCGELVKTKGHYHPPDPAGIDYPELYEVFGGTGHFLLQNRHFSEIFLVKATAGQKILVPPGCGHVTINPDNEQLVMANIVSREFKSDYLMFERMHGASYFEMTGPYLVKNPLYRDIPEPKIIGGGNVRGGAVLAMPLYDLVGKRQNLDFLNRPEDYPEFFTMYLK